MLISTQLAGSSPIMAAPETERMIDGMNFLAAAYPNNSLATAFAYAAIWSSVSTFRQPLPTQKQFPLLRLIYFMGNLLLPCVFPRFNSGQTLALRPEPLF